MSQSKSGMESMASQTYPDLTSESVSAVDAETMKRFRPAPGLLLIRCFPPKKETKGGLALPDRFAIESDMATVLAAPDGQCRYAIGDVVLIRHNSGTIFPLEDDLDRRTLIVQFSDEPGADVLGKFEGGLPSEKT